MVEWVQYHGVGQETPHVAALKVSTLPIQEQTISARLFTANWRSCSPNGMV
jgi:hypothetical protein